MIEDYINNLKFHYNNPLSVKDKIRDLVGEVCLYNGNGAKEEQMSEKESILKHIKFVDKRNQKQVDKFYGREILIMKHLREAHHEQSPFRHTIFN